MPLRAETLPSAPSGIEGVIYVAPARPGPLRKDGPNSAPAGNLEFFVKTGETRVTAFSTDADGHFRIAVPPGHYIVIREDPGARIGHWQFEVDVASGAIAKVSWTGNSGMR